MTTSNKHSESDYPDLNNSMDIVSATDCTGLIPAGIASEEELDFYRELYPYSPADIPDGSKSDETPPI